MTRIFNLESEKIKMGGILPREGELLKIQDKEIPGGVSLN